VDQEVGQGQSVVSGSASAAECVRQEGNSIARAVEQNRAEEQRIYAEESQRKKEIREAALETRVYFSSTDADDANLI
jgi:hypothetical protein